jgi:tetratricopeptide (TPR) repeat protein
MGEVYEAQDRLLQDATIALKTISQALARSTDALERFEREVLLARQVTHPNVCPIYDICYHEDEQGVSCFLSMKLLPGETLAARLDRQRQLPYPEAITVVTQMLSALNAAHRANVIHRDIKPSNIILDGSGADVHAVVTDFGLARTRDNETSLSTVSRIIGTPGYIAPEVLKHHAASAATDLYALGVVVNEIFGGNQPSGGAPVQLAESLRAPGVPSFLLELTVACLGDDPGRRIAAFDNALAELNLDPARRSATPLPPVVARPFWSRRRWLAAAATAGCAVGGTTVWEWDDIHALFNPLPKTRHVALVNWPPNSELRFAPALLGVIDALERELARAEAFDSDLYVVSALSMTKDDAQVPGSLGANLMLASSVEFLPQGVHLTLEIMDAAATRLFRRRRIKCSIDELTALPGMAVRAAAELLGVSQYVQPGQRLKVGTDSAEAYRAFQEADALRHKPNDEGLEGAIEKYKAAIEADGHYAPALARLADAYTRLYWVHHDPAAMDLAKANASAAISFDANLTQAHLVLGSVWWYGGGNAANANAEFEKALKLDPSDPEGLIAFADFLADTNQLARAEEMFQRVLKVRPNYWVTYNDYANFLRLQGRYKEALRYFREGHLANPQNSYLLANLGQVALKSGLLQEARDSISKSMALGPSAIAAASMAMELRAEGKSSEALEFAQKAIALDPDDDEICLVLGDCLSVSGHREKAQAAYARAAEKAQAAMQMSSADGQRWMLLALYQAKLSQSGALASLQKAEALGAADLDSQLIKIRVLEVLGKRVDALNTIAACFRRGATKFEMDHMPDLQSLRADARYLTVFHPR